jgi:chromosome segregation ATPase
MATTEQVQRVTVATLQLEKLERKLADARTAIRAAQELEHEAEQAIHRAQQELREAEAARDSNFYPVGTRVRHHHWGDIEGTVVESDGTGVAVQQDGATGPSYGFTSREWVRL